MPDARLKNFKEMAEISDNELEELKARKLSALQKAQAERNAKERAFAEAQAQIERAMRGLLTQDAFDQWSTAKMSNPDNAFLVASELIRLAQGGQLKGKITKEQVKAALNVVYKQTHREIKIRRK